MLRAVFPGLLLTMLTVFVNTSMPIAVAMERLLVAVGLKMIWPGLGISGICFPAFSSNEFEQADIGARYY